MKNNKTRTLAYLALFMTIIIIMSITPLGYLNLGVIKATLIHIPVIVGSLILGPRYGLILGIVFGLTSIIQNTLNPSVLSFAFSPFIPVIGTDRGSVYAILIALLPRMIVGYLPGFLLKSNTSDDKIRISRIALLSSGLNTVLVLGLIALLFKDAYALANNININQVYKLIASIILINGLPEAIISMIIVPPLINVMNHIKH